MAAYAVHMPMTVDAHNAALNAIAVTHAAIHSANPPTSGSALCARTAISYGTAASSERATTAATPLAITSNGRGLTIGLWSAASGGVLLSYTVLPNDPNDGQPGRSLVTGDTYTVNAGSKLTLTATA